MKGSVAGGIRPRKGTEFDQTPVSKYQLRDRQRDMRLSNSNQLYWIGLHDNASYNFSPHCIWVVCESKAYPGIDREKIAFLHMR